MRGKHLTRRGDPYVFQTRLPCKLAGYAEAALIRVTLGRLPRRKVQHAARLLGAAASLAPRMVEAALEGLGDLAADRAAGTGTLAERAQERHRPLFSVAADAYHEKQRKAHGGGYDELK